MNHLESKLQQQCVAWFRAQYRQYAMLLTHPSNEGNGNHVTGAIHKAEGTVAGVPDLLLFVPSYYKGRHFGVLGIEMKTDKGRQSQSQKDFQRLFSAAQNCYVIVRSLDEFKSVLDKWMSNVPVPVRRCVADTSSEIQEEQRQRDVARFKRIIRNVDDNTKRK